MGLRHLRERVRARAGPLEDQQAALLCDVPCGLRRRLAEAAVADRAGERSVATRRTTHGSVRFASGRLSAAVSLFEPRPGARATQRLWYRAAGAAIARKENRSAERRDRG